jgi:hypothetical protein
VHALYGTQQQLQMLGGCSAAAHQPPFPTATVVVKTPVSDCVLCCVAARNCAIMFTYAAYIFYFWVVPCISVGAAVCGAAFKSVKLF